MGMGYGASFAEVIDEAGLKKIVPKELKALNARLKKLQVPLDSLAQVVLERMDELETEEDAQATKRRGKSHKKRVDSYAYTPLSKPGPDKHLRGYLVTIDALTEHKGVEYHHEGEEFVFVLRGGITVQVGENVSRLARGESLHFNSALHHKLSNSNPEVAELLVVIYVP